MQNFKIESEFQDLIPTISKEEYSLLEQSIKSEGCRDPLVVWSENNILLDGHNRYQICLIHKLPYKITKKSFPSADKAKAWMLLNQLARRNLSPSVMSALRGCLYNLQKMTKAEAGASKGQNDTCSNTAEKIARQTGVSEATIKRDGKFAESIDKLDKADPTLKLKEKIMKFDPEAPKKTDVVKAAEVVEDKPELAKKILSGETVCQQLNAIEDKLTENSGVKVCLAFFMETSSLAQKAFAPRILKTINSDGRKAIQKEFKKWFTGMETYQDLFIKNARELEK